MQKVLTEMNVQLANVISDISGLTGMAIIQGFWRENETDINWPISPIFVFRQVGRKLPAA
jgi:hypothetical protein